MLPKALCNSGSDHTRYGLFLPDLARSHTSYLLVSDYLVCYYFPVSSKIVRSAREKLDLDVENTDQG